MKTVDFYNDRNCIVDRMVISEADEPALLRMMFNMPPEQWAIVDKKPVILGIPIETSKHLASGYSWVVLHTENNYKELEDTNESHCVGPESGSPSHS